MEEPLEHDSGWRSKPWRIAAWATAAGLMLVPITVQLVRGDFGWSSGDFILIGVILFTSCFIFDLAARKAPNLSYLAGAGAGLAAGCGLFLVNGAVGLVGSEDEPHNLLFVVVILVAIAGAVAARGRPRGMARGMLAAGLTHIVVSAALLVKAGGVSDGDPGMEVIGLAVFAGLWLTSAGLFRNAFQIAEAFDSQRRQGR